MFANPLQMSHDVPRLPSFLEMLQNPHVLLTFDNVHNPLRLPRKTTSEHPKVVRTCCALYILTLKCASRHNSVHFFDISTSKNGLIVVCFVHFDFEMCFAPQQRALFRHLNFQKCSKGVVFLAFSLAKSCKCVSHHNSVHFFDISTSKNAPNVKCLSPHLCVGFLFLILYPGSSSFSSSAPPLAHIIFHTQLCHTPSFTYNFVTHHLSHTWQAWHLATCVFISRGRRGTWRRVPSFHVAGVALGDMCLISWHLETSTFVLRGKRGTYGTGLALVARLDWISRR